jgi:hypothetical protein
MLDFRLALVGVIVAAAPAVASAQTQIPGTPYTRLQAPVTYTELSNPTVLASEGSSLEAPVELPFSFRFYDQTVTSVLAGNAGALVFDPAATQVSTVNATPGSTTTPNGWIAPFWDSMTMYAAQGAHLAYQIDGVAPNRRITFEWRNVNHAFSATGMEWFNFQVRLYEGLAGRIEIDFGPQGPTAATSVSATMGMEDLSGARPVLFAPSGCASSSCVLNDYLALVGQRVTLVQDPGIEIVPLSIATPQFATLGVETPVRVGLANLHGTALGPFSVELFASPDESGQNATPLGELTLSLGPYQTNEVTLLMNPPVTLEESSYFLVLQVDTGGVVNEVDELNNVIVSAGQVRFLPSRPDFDVARVLADQTMVSAGTSVEVETRIINAGSQPITNGEVAVMMSTNTAISPQDVELARFTITLAPGETMDVITSVTIPAETNSGTYWLGALADPGNALQEVSEANNGRAALTDLGVAGGNLAILTTQLPAATKGSSYVAILNATGGDGSVSWRVIEGMLPTGVGLVRDSGEFYGRPQTEGVYAFTVEATSGSQTDSQALTLTVSDPLEPLTIVTRAVPSAVLGQEYEFQLRATGGASTSSLAWSATGLPTGISITNDGILTGSAIAIGTSVIDVTVTSGTETAMRTLELSVTENANLQIVPTVLPRGTYQQPYDAQITATGGLPPITFFLELGELPEGLDLSADGRISGTPLEVGRFRLVVQARDSGPGGVAAIDVNTFELVIDDAEGFQIVTSELPVAIVNQGYTAVVEASGGLAPYDWSLKGRLPSGMIANLDADGNFLIVGTASEPSTTNLLLEVVDAQGRTARRALALVVTEAPVGPTPEEEQGGCTSTRGHPEGSTLLWFALLGLVFFLRRFGS